MELHQLRYFVAVAESGSISRAARRCRVAQPSLSQQLKRLEESLGQRLFDRLGRGVAMTDAGRALLPRARRIIADVRDAETALREEGGAKSPRLAIGAIPTIAPYVLPRLVAGLKRESPGGEYLIREDLTENLAEALADNEIDVAIVSTPLEHELIEVEVIGREPMVVVMPRGHPLERAGAVGISDLRSTPAVTLHEMHCLGRQIGAFCAERSIARPIVCRTTQLATLLELVRQGSGISIVPAMAARHDSGRGLAFVELKRGTPQREIALAWRVGRTKPGLAGRLRELLIRQLERASGGASESAQ